LVLYARGVEPCSGAGPNAHNQIGPQATTAWFKLCRLNNALAAHRRSVIPFKNRNACLKIWIFSRAT